MGQKRTWRRLVRLWATFDILHEQQRKRAEAGSQPYAAIALGLVLSKLAVAPRIRV
jgi:hypothetical protein